MKNLFKSTVVAAMLSLFGGMAFGNSLETGALLSTLNNLVHQHSNRYKRAKNAQERRKVRHSFLHQLKVLKKRYPGANSQKTIKGVEKNINKLLLGALFSRLNNLANQHRSRYKAAKNAQERQKVRHSFLHQLKVLRKDYPGLVAKGVVDGAVGNVDKVLADRPDAISSAIANLVIHHRTRYKAAKNAQERQKVRHSFLHQLKRLKARIINHSLGHPKAFEYQASKKKQEKTGWFTSSIKWLRKIAELMVAAEEILDPPRPKRKRGKRKKRKKRFTNVGSPDHNGMNPPTRLPEADRPKIRVNYPNGTVIIIDLPKSSGTPLWKQRQEMLQSRK